MLGIYIHGALKFWCCFTVADHKPDIPAPSSSLSPYLFQTSTSHCHNCCCCCCCCSEHSQTILWPYFRYVVCTHQCNSVTLLILWYEALPWATQLGYAWPYTYCAHISCDSKPPHQGNTANFILSKYLPSIRRHINLTVYRPKSSEMLHHVEW